MKVFFCDHCNESVPLADLEGGVAAVAGDRVLCARCRPPSLDSGFGRRAVLYGSLAGAILGALVAGAWLWIAPRGEDRPAAGSPSAEAMQGLEQRTVALGNDVRELRALFDRGVPADPESLPPQGEEAEERGAGSEGATRVPGGFDEERLQAWEARLAALERRMEGPAGRSGGGRRAEGEGVRPEGRQEPAGPGTDSRAGGEAWEELRERMNALELRELAIEKSLTELEAAARRGVLSGGSSPSAPEGVGGEPGARPAASTEEARDAVRWEDLLGKLAEEDPGLRWEAVEGLAATGRPQAVPYLLQALGDPDPFVRFQAAKSVGTFGDRRAIEPLLQALEDEEEMVRESAHESLRVLTLQSLPFDPQAPPEERGRDISTWKAWWRSAQARGGEAGGEGGR